MRSTPKRKGTTVVSEGAGAGWHGEYMRGDVFEVIN